MNENEDYLRITKSGVIHTLSDRIPFKWKELMVITPAIFIFLIWFLGNAVGILILLLSSIGYTLYRCASWIYYTELKIDEKSGKITRLTKILNRIQKIELISENFDPNRFEYTELTRSGKTKFLMHYRTHKNNEILILKNKADKELVEKYITEKITITKEE